VLTVPGEHDILEKEVKSYLNRFGGALGREQPDWLGHDMKQLTASTSIVVDLGKIVVPVAGQFHDADIDRRIIGQTLVRSDGL